MQHYNSYIICTLVKFTKECLHSIGLMWHIRSMNEVLRLINLDRALAPLLLARSRYISTKVHRYKVAQKYVEMFLI